MNTHVLGLDLGATSVGWALVRYENGKPVQLVDAGARIFEAGVEGDLESGQEESRGKKRRDARQIRKQIERRARRHLKLAHILQHSGLLPDGAIDSGHQRHEYLQALDGELRQGINPEDNPPAAVGQTFPYWLRARALDVKLEPHALGRALYHLAQRRGFLSNRKAPDKDDDRSVVKQGISELQDLMNEKGSRTLGEFFATLDPSDPSTRRIRQRWTHRDMYQHEFDAIWDAQTRFHPDLLTSELRARVEAAIFYQRPLKSQKHLIGRCELEPERHRAPLALLASQRFRLLQKVNDLLVIDPDHRKHPLTPEQRNTIIETLEGQTELKFTRARRLLELPARGYRFNFETDGEKRLVGNRTAAKLRKIFGGAWDAMPPEEREGVVEDILSFENEKALARRGREHYGLDEASAKALGEVELEPGYCNLSRQAIANILPHLEEGLHYINARDKAYKDDHLVGYRLIPDFLPPLVDAPLPDLRNPAVQRVLTELRKVVNAVIQKHGKPDTIRIELARDLKRSRDHRKRTSKRNRQNQKARENAAKKILDDMGNPNPRRDDILRVLLAEESNWECPYTGRHIGMKSLVGETSQFDIEHIIPFSRCLDDSFLNKTLCYHEENRAVKRNRTPFEAYHDDEERWNEIIERVKRFRGDGREAKLRRFRMDSLESLDDFTSRQLNDTRYASTLAAKYLAVLYGPEFRKHIQVSAGQTTAQLRNAWRLNSILGDGGGKSRDDHRHHAVDAIAIALTEPKMIKSISEAAQKAEHHGKLRWWKTVPLPWESFVADVQTLVDGITVSHRVSRKVNGPLHEETNYSPPRTDEDGTPYVHVRKPVDALSPARRPGHRRPPPSAKLSNAPSDEAGTPPPKAFADAKNHPRLPSGMPIHRVRIRKNMTPFTVGEAAHRQRHVASGSNHHMEIVEATDKKGQPKWKGIVISQYEAMRRLRNKEPIVRRGHGSGAHFIGSLAPGDMFQLNDDSGTPGIYVARSVSREAATNKVTLEFVRLNDARQKKAIKATREWFKRTPNVLRTLGFQKLTITPTAT